MIAINKSAAAKTVTIALAGKEWKSAVAYGFSTDSVITKLADPTGVTAAGFDYALPATSATHFVVSTDAQVVLPSPDLVPLSVEIVGQGTVTRSLRTALLPRGTVVTLNATPADGWTFGGWAKDGTGKTTTLAVTMDAPRTVQAVFLSAANLIANGDFSNGTTGWTPSAWSQDGAAAGTPSVKDGVFTFAVTNGGTETWNVQIFQTAVPFVKGTTYTLSFDASASKARSIKAYANQGAFDKSVALETTSKTFSYTFVSDSTESGKLSFDIGGAAAAGTTVQLDNVSIVASTGTGIVGKSSRSGSLLQQGGKLLVDGAGTLVLVDARGATVLRREIRSATRVDLSALPRGLYVARFQDASTLVRKLD